MTNAKKSEFSASLLKTLPTLIVALVSATVGGLISSFSAHSVIAIQHEAAKQDNLVEAYSAWLGQAMEWEQDIRSLRRVESWSTYGQFYSDSFVHSSLREHLLLGRRDLVERFQEIESEQARLKDQLSSDLVNASEADAASLATQLIELGSSIQESAGLVRTAVPEYDEFVGIHTFIEMNRTSLQSLNRLTQRINMLDQSDARAGIVGRYMKSISHQSLEISSMAKEDANVAIDELLAELATIGDELIEQLRSDFGVSR